MRPFEIKGDTPEKKFKNLERILQRMQRRLHKTVVGLVPASPVFGYCADPANDAIIRAIFPADGLITKVAVFFGRRGKANPNIEIRLERMDGTSHESYTVSIPKKGLVAEVNYSIKAGTRVQAIVVDPDEEVGDVWVGFLYEVGIKDMTKNQIAIEQFEQLTGDFDATDEEG